MKRIPKLSLTVGAVLLMVVGASASGASRAAHADNVIGVNRTQARSGLTGGVALGVGHLGCDSNECDQLVEAAGISAHLGGMLAPRLALVGDLWGMSHQDGRSTVSQTILTAALRWWPADVIWLSGGVGVARASFHYDGDLVEFMNRSDTVPGLMAAAGVEVVRSNTFALEVQVRAGTGIYDEDERIRNYALSIGASFY